MGGYHKLTPEQKEWVETQLNKRTRLANRRYGIAVDYKPDLSGIGVYLQVLVPSIKASLGEPRYEEVWLGFPKNIASRTRPMVRGWLPEEEVEELEQYAADYIYEDNGDMEELEQGYG